MHNTHTHTHTHTHTGAKSFVGVAAPHLILNKPSLVAGDGMSDGFMSYVARVLMQGFAGMQVCAPQTVYLCEPRP